MKRLVTGGTGLVGSAIIADVKVGRNYDLTNPLICDSMFNEHKPTHVIHCAAKVGGLGGNMNYKGEYFRDNIMINTNVIESARKAGVTNLVSFLSTCVFPDDIEYPLTEKKIHLGEPHFSNYPYAYAKRMADIQIRAYREQYGLNYKSVIPTKTVNAPKPAVAKTVDSPKGPYNVFTNPDRMSPIREQQEITEYYRQVLIQRLDEEEKKLITGSAARASLPSKGKLSTILISSISEIVPKYELISANNGAFSNG
jgi:GDP-L-fucose synthase